MCSVVGYIGKQLCRSFILDGLERLEYRGYDSAGFACLNFDSHRIVYTKTQGRLSVLRETCRQNPIDGYVGIGHTRWSTHGVSTQENAHPHFDCEKKIAIVHNGVIENFHVLKESLVLSGHIFHSATDTEIIAHLFEEYIITHLTLTSTIIAVLKKIEGAYAFIALLQEFPEYIVLVRKRSPLCIGIGIDEMFIASDVFAFADKTQTVVYLPDESFALVTKDTIKLYSFNGDPLPIATHHMPITNKHIQHTNFEHHMLKEIYEQKSAIHATVDFLSTVSHTIWNHLGVDARFIQEVDHIYLIGCGTSWHAGGIAQYFFEEIAHIPTTVYLASEFRYRSFFPDKRALYVAISQSGETADTLEAVRMINACSVPTIGLTNIASSTLVRESGGFLLTQAGREVAVASTKAFTTQLAALYWLAHGIACEKGIINSLDMEIVQEDILVAAEVLENTIENYKFEIYHTLAQQYMTYTKAIFLGRHMSYPFAQEAALKLKEIAYIFSHAYPAGELKHGPLALVDDEIPIFVFSHPDPIVYQKLVLNIQEIKARGGYVIAFAFEGQRELQMLADKYFVIPRVKPLLSMLAMSGIVQFLIYAIARELDCPIDNPRNLAKSVTVE